MMKMVKSLILFYSQLASKMAWLPPLLTRGIVGWVFCQTGWGKLHNLEKVIEFFTSLGIPYPEVQAPFVASVEFGGGLALLLGLGTRIVAIPLSIIMVVALVTAQSEEITDLNSLFGLSEFLYIALMAWLITTGPGKFSIDHVLRKQS